MTATLLTDSTVPDAARSPRRVVMAENLVWETGVTVGSHHYARCITDVWGAELLWVALPWTPFHLLSRSTSARARRRAWGFGVGTRPHPRIRVLSPLSMLQYRATTLLDSPSVARLAMELTVPSLRGRIRAYGFETPDVLWITDPRQVDIIRLLRPAKVVYRCPDHFQHFSDIPASVATLERRLVERADLVVTSSIPLVEHLATLGARARYVPNGVDVDRFVDARPSDSLGRIPAPRVLYAGAMGEWFDADLMRATAQGRPSISFVLAGPIRTDLGGLLSLPNVHYLGSLPYDEMPGLMNAAEVGIVPFRAGDIGSAVNPIKMYEYLASGLPVVMSGIGDLGGVKFGVVSARSPGEFVTAIDAALANRRRSDYVASLRDEAGSHSWKARFAVISSELGF